MRKKHKVDFDEEADFGVGFPTATISTVRRRRSKLKKYLILLILVGLLTLPVLAYYYQKYSAIIDQGLAGKIFERSSGIYAAPLTLQVNRGFQQNDLIRYLRDTGYVQLPPSANDSRGRFAISANSIEITPSSDATINNVKMYPSLRVSFSANGISSITDLDKRQNLNEAQVEPEKISSTINPEREKRKNIEFKDLPKSLVDAVVAIEDRTFFDHSGISLRGILRAFTRNAEAGEITEGGSTITQQLVKTFFLTPERTWKRKISEAYMSLILERKLDKQRILAMYCNQIYLGQRGGFSINGFGEGARSYFGKDVAYLNLHESALLAGIVQSPNYYSPYSHPDRARNRRDIVLNEMLEQGKIKPEEAKTAKAQPLGVIGKGGTDANDAPYFVDYVLRQLDTQYGDDSQSMRSLRIYTSVDLDLQRAAYAAVQNNLPEIDRQVLAKRGTTAGLQIALVAMNAKTGDILAMVGGRDYASSQLNRAADARRQPGSVFKPFVYAAAFSESDSSRRITAASMFRDEPRSFDYDGRVYAPDNFRDSYELRTMSAREALAKSKNVITVSIAEKVGFSQVASFAERAGLPKVLPVPASSLGTSEATPLQVASAYTPFANQGRRAAPLAVKRLTTKEGTVLYEKQPEITEAMSPQVSYLMTSILQDVLTYGTGSRARQAGIAGSVAGKTGTSRDGWFAGYSPNLVCVVWIGFDDGSDFGVTGGTTAALVWGDFMSRALAVRPELAGEFEIPVTGLVTQYIGPNGEAARLGTVGTRKEIFLNGTQQNGESEPLEPPPGSATPTTPLQPQQTQTASGGASTPPPSASGQSPADTMIPITPEGRGKVSLSQPTPTPDNRGVLRRMGDSILGFFSTTPAPVPVQPAPAPKTNVAGGTKTPNQPTTTRTPNLTQQPVQAAQAAQATTQATTTAKQNSQSQTTKPSQAIQTATPQPPQVAPTLKYANGAVGPTPWPTPVATRPRVVPTPTPELAKPPKAVTTATAKNANKKAEKKTTAKNAKGKNAKAPAKPSAKTKASAAPKAAVKKEPTPTPTPKEPPVKKQFNIEVCAVSGKIPVKGLCTTRVRRSYNLGEEPTQTCTADKHK